MKVVPPVKCQRLFIRFGAVVLASWVFGSGDLPAQEGPVFFREQIHPLLERACFKCHGGGEKLKGNFRLTSREGLLRGGDLGAAFDADHPAESALLAMISYSDPDHQMPPKGKLPDSDIALLKRWVDMGAPYDVGLEIAGPPGEGKKAKGLSSDDRNYWAYQPVTAAVAPPAVSDPEWAKNPIDAFIYKQLEEAGLHPSGPAPREVLIRRGTYDLTGLPPTEAEVKRFVEDPRPDHEAWRIVIDGLLARPQYGETWARHWLDVVRYAETNGFERDGKKPHIWRYRDYVINAFNQDKPYDQFIIEQLAGDEIESPTEESLVATGYHRLMQWDDEPADRMQHLYDVLADDVLVTSEAFLATTLGCARCHDHKADPVTQKDFYSFMAFFHGISPYNGGGTLVHYASPEASARFEKDRAARELALKKEIEAGETKLRSFLQSQGFLSPSSGAQGEVRTFVEDARSGGAEWEYTIAAPTPDWKDVGFRDKSWLKGRGGFGAKGTPGAQIGTEWRTGDIWMRTSFGLTALPQSLSLDIHHDEDVEVYLNGLLVFEAKGFLKDYELVVLGEEAVRALQTGRNILAIHCHQNGGGQYVDAALRTGRPEVRSLQELVKGKNLRLQEAVMKEFGRDELKAWSELGKQLEAVRSEKPGVAINAVTENGRQPAPLNIHLRGSAHALGDAVEPAYPAVLCADSASVVARIPDNYGNAQTSGRRRLLAEWIASPANPLTGKVIMNRLWQHQFGRGIVATPNDFGKLGERPTHPELLSWLAGELVRQGWSLKNMQRLIMTSRTYCQSSLPEAEGLKIDPENRLLWRQNMRRLTAEELRDSLLAVTGVLNLKSGGESVFPPLPPEVLATSSRPGAAWGQSSAEDAVRRSVYIHIKRSLRDPFLADHDQADTDSPCAARFNSTVPTQALAMLNSAFVNDQARVFAERLLREGGADDRSRVVYALGLVTQRVPLPDEIDHCLGFLKRLRTEAGLDDHAALERFALLALNLNEFIYLD